MPLYRFRILDKFGRRIAGQFSHLLDDDEARRHAVLLRERTKDHAVEVWQDERQVPDLSVLDGDEKPPRH